MAGSTLQPCQAGQQRETEGNAYSIPGQTHVLAAGPNYLNSREASRAPSERSTHFDISEQDFLSVRGPRSQPSTMGTNNETAGRGGCAPTRKNTHRKLILCFDGTGNKFHGDDSDSNILKIFRMLDRTANDQYHYYQPGIGTYVVSKSLSHTSLRSRIRSWYMKAKDSAVGSSFDEHVVGGYRFLMRFYCPGDEIYIFGFSRGAYIARFLAEMLDYVGLLSHGNEEMVAFAWKAFSQWQCRRSTSDSDEVGQQKKREMYAFLKGFRETFSRPVRRIRFLGLFDTVNSVPRFETAWMERSKFPYTARSSARVIRHAVSIDERRAKFRQDLMYQSGEKEGQHRRHHHDPMQNDAAQTEDRGRRAPKDGKLTLPTSDGEDGPLPYRAHSRSKSRNTRKTAETASDYSMIAPYDDGDSDSFESDEDEKEQDIDEVWFAGAMVTLAADGLLISTSHVPLVWMVREAIKAGLLFDIEKVVAMGCSEALGSSTTSEVPRSGNGMQTTVPDIRVDASSPPVTPMIDQGRAKDKSRQSSTTETGDEHPHSDFDEMLHKAHVARIHDSLSYDCGMSPMSVLSWKLMEYMPFRRMDLQGDGTWKPIRWPLPCGEVRDVPDNARVHGSVIRRMKQDKRYRPGNLIVGGGGERLSGCTRVARYGRMALRSESGRPSGRNLEAF
ncbi:hypothetical protein N0V93_007947 [Gnomoniopsis smithogilvyi]|uniref:T6SS Phospholipase effector Tle1-like catalytic domain-containing protein n=1 Tax=Gnomoniopsis smithogilvyi TaxID=1191159 RepID=A0A9W8YLR2_9PEZI|nr:hypothetical protein N0V93_007947 [Gnomoniopsis smithogilvyi]